MNVYTGWDIATPSPSSKTVIAKNLKENNPSTTAAKQPVGGVATALTVGFSGTNDVKTLLPLNVLQSDLPGLVHTNAEVLTYLLQPRNRRYVPASDPRGRRLSEKAFLHLLKERSIRMLLDAGAQILELDNIALAKTWLLIDTEAEAAVFFGEDERARVVYRDGKIQPLAASPYHDKLGACVVYLVSPARSTSIPSSNSLGTFADREKRSQDEAHTRGVDLKMPPRAVAALTLGVMQTKDHTVQGKIPSMYRVGLCADHHLTISCHATTATGDFSIGHLLCATRSAPEHSQHSQGEPQWTHRLPRRDHLAIRADMLQH